MDQLDQDASVGGLLVSWQIVKKETLLKLENDLDRWTLCPPYYLTWLVMC
jgi:hypothetical protein